MEKRSNQVDIDTYTALSPQEATGLKEMFTHFIKVCLYGDLEYWVQCGTMLGAVRCGGLVRWDDDIDLAMDKPDYIKLKSLKSKLEGGGFNTQNVINKSEWIKGKRIPQYKVKYVGQYMKLEHLGFMDSTGEAGIWLDVFCTDKGIYPQKHCSICNCPDEDRLPLKEFKFQGVGIVNVPQKHDMLLDREFKGWRSQAVVYNHRGPKKKSVKGEKVFAKWGGYQHFGTYLLSDECNRPY